MTLTMVRDTVDGVDHIGCRASGIHKGHHIERTAWQPIRDFVSKSFDWLETLAVGNYNKEVEAIDRNTEEVAEKLNERP
jgi:hypothetical protein